jgi:tetratricopeptide (TPR) repeat protein
MKKALALRILVASLVSIIVVSLLARPLIRKSDPLDKGKLLYKDGKFAEAAAAYREEIQAHPEDIAASAELGRTLIALKRYDEAIQILNQTVTRIPSAMDPYQMLGEAYTGAHRPKEAVDAFQHVLALEPTRVHTHLMLGQAYADMGKKNEAIAEWEKVIQYDPHDEGPLAQKLINFQRR